MRSSQFEKESDSLFDADNRNPDAAEMSANELDFTNKGGHMRSEADVIRNWYYKHWISYKEYLRLTNLPF